MGFVLTLGRRSLEIVLVFLVIVYMPGLPPKLEFTSYRVTPPQPLEGALAVNGRLNNAEHLFENQIRGPESIAEYNGELYTGLLDGQVVKISNGQIIPVAKFGQPCAGDWEEEICGRPLGMKFAKDGILYVADAYYGIFKVDVKTGLVTKLVSTSVPIEGKVPMIPHCVDIASDGTVYWTDSSTEMQLMDGVFLALGDGSGRLLKYDPKTNSSTVLLDKLGFPYGVILSPKEDYVLVTETQVNDVRRYYLKGPKKGTSDIFTEGLPGMPDNIKSDGSGGYFVSLVITTDDTNNLLITQLVSPLPVVRKFVARILAFLELPFKQVELLYPNYYTKRVVHWIGGFEPVQFLAPKRVTIVHINGRGKIIDSLHCLDESLSWVSDVHLFQDAYYFGSPVNNYIGRVQLKKESTKQEI